MATAVIRFGGAMGGGAPVYAPIPSASADLDVSSSSAATTVTATAGDYVRIVAIGADIRIAIGQAPTAIATRGDIIPAGTAFDAGPLKQGDKVAAILSTAS